MRRSLALCAGLCAALGLAVVAAGCNPLDFDNLRSEAPTIRLVPPGDFPNSRFGTVIAPVEGTIDGVHRSLLGASAGPESPYLVYPGFTEGRIGLDVPLFTDCRSADSCGDNTGTALVGVPELAGERLCMISTAPTDGSIRYRCASTSQAFSRDGDDGVQLGAAAAGVPAHPAARAFFGAPTANANEGTVYALPDLGNAFPLNLTNNMATAGALGTGTALAAGVLDDDTLLVVAGAPEGNGARAVVFTLDAGSTGDVANRACLRGEGAQFGGSVAVGDLNGDGVPDIAVGSGQSDSDTRSSQIRIYDGATLPAPLDGAEDCADWTPAIVLDCPADNGVAGCGGSQFGSTLAIGDLDRGMGGSELLVGAPFASVDGTGRAGAVFVFPGVADLSTLAPAAGALVRSQPNADDELGFTVAALPGPDTDGDGSADYAEVVASAPGADRIYVFTCSTVLGDTPDSTPELRCQDAAQ